MDVAGVERHGIGHQLGSSHGMTRLFRIACLEHPGLSPIARKSLELWTELGKETGELLIRQSGCLNVGTPDSRAVSGTLAADTEVVRLDHDELVERQPQYAGLQGDEIGAWDPGGGLCYAERNVRAHTAAAHRLGAEVYPHTMVTGIGPRPDGISIRTATVEFLAQHVVVAAGAWLGTLVESLSLAPRRVPLFWFRPKDPEFALDRFPAFIWERPDGRHLWGHGSAAEHGIKIGLVRPSPAVDPEELDRHIYPAADLDELSAAVSDAFPGIDPRPEKVIPCIYTDSPDGLFLVGPLPDEPRIVVAGGDSGHGFKHSAGIGELLAQLVTGETPYCDAGFLSVR
jgi:sarcosine oxidase